MVNSFIILKEMALVRQEKPLIQKCFRELLCLVLADSWVATSISRVHRWGKLLILSFWPGAQSSGNTQKTQVIQNICKCIHTLSLSRSLSISLNRKTKMPLRVKK